MKVHTIAEKFSNFLEKKFGVDIDGDKWNEVKKKLLPLEKHFGFTSSEECFTWILEHQDDRNVMDEIVRCLTIGETYFFRDPNFFSILRKNILPDIIQKNRISRCLRIWSAACSSGEEAYSIAMLIKEEFPELNDWKIFILASDINEAGLKKGKTGIYSKWSFRAMPAQYQAKYFEAKGQGHLELDEKIRSMVLFTKLNLAESPYPKNFGHFDLILCHNVLIYFSANQAKKTIHNLLNSLDNGRWLSVAAVEAFLVKEPKLKICYFPRATLFQKEGEESTFSAEAQSFFSANLEKQPPIKSLSTKKTEGYMELIEQKKFEEAAIQLEEKLLNQDEKSYDSKEIIALIRLYANIGNFDKAQDWLSKILQIEKFSPIFHFMQAEICLAQKNNDAAVASLKRAIFLDSDFTVGHYLLGVIEYNNKNFKVATKEFKTTLDLLANLQSDAILPGTEDLTVRAVRDYISSVIKHLI